MNGDSSEPQINRQSLQTPAMVRNRRGSGWKCQWFEAMEHRNTQQEGSEGETGITMAIAHSHNITLQLISRVPLPAMPNEIGLETLEQTQWTVA